MQDECPTATRNPSLRRRGDQGKLPASDICTPTSAAASLHSTASATGPGLGLHGPSRPSRSNLPPPSSFPWTQLASEPARQHKPPRTPDARRARTLGRPRQAPVAPERTSGAAMTGRRLGLRLHAPPRPFPTPPLRSGSPVERIGLFLRERGGLVVMPPSSARSSLLAPTEISS